MEATKTIVLFNPYGRLIITEVFEGEKYYLPLDNSVEVYEGTLVDFQSEFPEYNFNEE